MNPLEIIGRVYSLLGECSSSELLDAADIADSKLLMIALRDLAKTKDFIERRQSRKSRRSQSHTKKQSAKNGFEAHLERIVLDASCFENNAELAEFLNDLGLDVTFRDKDGRKRMLERLATSVRNLDSEKRKFVLSRIFSLLPKSETAGWFDAIRGEPQ